MPIAGTCSIYSKLGHSQHRSSVWII